MDEQESWAGMEAAELAERLSELGVNAMVVCEAGARLLMEQNPAALGQALAGLGLPMMGVPPA